MPGSGAARLAAILQAGGAPRHDAFPEEGPRDFAGRVAAAHPAQADSIHAITDLYVRLRYGKATGPAATADLSRLQRLVRRFPAAVRHLV